MTSIAVRDPLWRQRDFRLFWLGQGVSDVGSSVSSVVLPLVAVVYLHASAFEVGSLAALQWLPWLLVGLPAGVWVDRSRKRPILMAADSARMLLIASIPVAAALDALSIGQLLVAGFLTGLATVLFQVAYQPYLPTLVGVDDLPEGNAKLQGTQAAAGMIGPGVAGLLVAAVRAPFALVIDAASYLVSVLALTRIAAPEAPPAGVEQRSLRSEIAEGAAYVRADPLLRTLTLSAAAANFFLIGLEAITTLFLVRAVGVAPSAVGLLLALIGVGAVLGAVVARRVGGWIGTSRTIWLGTAATAPFGLLIPFTTRGAGLVYFVAGNVIVLAGLLMYNVTIGAFRQRYCPPRIHGRVVATMRFVLFGTMPFGSLLGGGLASAFGTRAAVWALVVGNLVPVAVLFFSPLRRIRDLPIAPPA